MSSSIRDSTVQFLDLSSSPSQCGYCGGRGSLSQGMYLDSLTVSDYQALLDRGWRRSGRYVYKPCMATTCCPLYTIRCTAGNYQPTKSQRKVVKKVRNFVKNGLKIDNDVTNNTETTTSVESTEDKKQNVEDTSVESFIEPGHVKRIEGLKKAKILRREKYLEKLIKSGKEPTSDGGKEKNKPKPLSSLMPHQNLFALNEKVLLSDQNSTHKFEIRLVKADLTDEQFMRSFHESFRVYRRYQTEIHKDKPSDCDVQTFAGFLCDSPLTYESRAGIVLGSFHQQYLVDGSIVAVGVVDLLPHCLSSVYLYYDPIWWGRGVGLSPGTYTAIREVQFTQQLGLPYYYMGFYVHSCPKMRYKGRFLPSDLLSPTLLSWHSIDGCLPKLEAAKYSTFSDMSASQSASDLPTMEVGKVRISVGGKMISYQEWRDREGNMASEEIEEYHELVGQDLAERLVLRWGGRGGNESDSESDN